MTMDRRSLLSFAGLAPLIGGAARLLPASEAPAATAPAPPEEKPDYTLRIAQGLVELASDRIVSTVLYNDRFPGPMLRFKEGRRITVELRNDTDTPELVHWHGQMIPSDVDGASEEGSPFVPPHGLRRIAFVPRPAGFRFAHSHVFAGSNLARGTYTGQAAPVYIEPREDAGAYDREVFLVLKEFLPTLSHGGDMSVDFLAGSPIEALQQQGQAADEQAPGPKGYEVGYDLFSINGRMLGHGEPVRVKHGERVLFHVLNASAGETRSLSLPGHLFHVVALDGNPVPAPTSVPVLWLGTAERISAIVAMDHPGVWVLGDLDDDDRRHGMGIVIEYAGSTGKPQWHRPRPFRWDYTLFGHPASTAVPAPARTESAETIEMSIVKHNAAAGGFNLWTLNGHPFSTATMQPRYEIHAGQRYRLKFRNASDDIHPLHLHRHSFELTRIHGKATSGVIKDVVMLAGFQELELEFLADNPGLTLFHCHQQLHMDFGFMALFKYV